MAKPHLLYVHFAKGTGIKKAPDRRFKNFYFENMFFNFLKFRLFFTIKYNFAIKFAVKF